MSKNVSRQEKPGSKLQTAISNLKQNKTFSNTYLDKYNNLVNNKVNRSPKFDKHAKQYDHKPQTMTEKLNFLKNKVVGSKMVSKNSSNVQSNPILGPKLQYNPFSQVTPSAKNANNQDSYSPQKDQILLPNFKDSSIALNLQKIEDWLNEDSNSQRGLQEGQTREKLILVKNPKNYEPKTDKIDEVEIQKSFNRIDQMNHALEKMEMDIKELDSGINY